MGQSNERENMEKTEQNPEIENSEPISIGNVVIEPKEQTILEKDILKYNKTPIEKLTDKFLDFLLALNKKIEPVVKSPLGKFILILLIFLFFAVPVLLTVLGFDNYIIRSKVEGQIRDINGSAIKDAQIEIQSKIAKSDESGKYLLEDMDYGKWKVKITADGYETLEEDITLERFGNKKDFELYPLDFGSISGSLVSDELKLDQAKLKVNDQDIEIKEDGTFSSDRLVVGGYTLTLESPYYKDLNISIDIHSGTNAIEPINLDPAGDIIGVAVDFLSEEKLTDVEIKSKGTDEPLEEDEEGFRIKNIDINSIIDLSFEKQGYKKVESKVKVVQGENSLDKVRMIPEGKVFSYVGNSIQFSDIDGKNQVNLTPGLFDCKFLFQNGNSLISKCQNKIYSSVTTGGTPTQIADAFNIGGVTRGLDTVQINNTGSSTITVESEVVFTAATPAEDIISFVSDKSGSNLYFSTTQSVYKKSLGDGSSAQKITDGIFYLHDVSYDGSTLVSLNNANSSGSLTNIWTIKTNGEKNRITVFPKSFGNLVYVDDKNILFTVFEGGKTNLYTRDTQSGSDKLLQTNIERFIFNKDKNLITTTIGSSITILNISGKNYKIQ